jgi:hypothetical protein
MEILDANAEVQENPSRDIIKRQTVEHNIITASNSRENGQTKLPTICMRQ